MFSIKKAQHSVKNCMNSIIYFFYSKAVCSIRALTERVVLVLSRMKCPYALEPHQIQGGDFIHIYPVVQWLVKRVFERRADIGDFNRSYTLNQYEKYFHEHDSNEQSNIFTQNIQTIRVNENFNRIIDLCLFFFSSIFRHIVDLHVVIDV